MKLKEAREGLIALKEEEEDGDGDGNDRFGVRVEVCSSMSMVVVVQHDDLNISLEESERYGYRQKEMGFSKGLKPA